MCVHHIQADQSCCQFKEGECVCITSRLINPVVSSQDPPFKHSEGPLLVCSAKPVLVCMIFDLCLACVSEAPFPGSEVLKLAFVPHALGN